MNQCRTKEDLRYNITRINGRGYKAYKELEGEYSFGDWTLYLDHAQGDPFAAPSRLRARVPQSVARFPQDSFSNNPRRIALQDYLIRQFDQAIHRCVRGHRGIGKSGLVAIDVGGQEILDRSAMIVTPQHIEARFVVGLPAEGRTILGRECEAILIKELPQVVKSALYYPSLSVEEIKRFIELVEDQEIIRQSLAALGLVAFVGNGAILPRRSGISNKPLAEQEVIKFQSPPALEVELSTPNNGLIRGMGISQGINLIVGGGYHGKSTLLRAIERGVYNHIPGDGREWVITRSDAVKIRAEDGRQVTKVDISSFINNLPNGKKSNEFSTEEASGSTSQAANIMEALEIGTRLLLLDEDTSASNFMIRDARMQRLVDKNKEPITPLIDKVESLHYDLRVSSILVVGGSGDYFDVATNIIMMDGYKAYEVTRQAQHIARELKTNRRKEEEKPFGEVPKRIPVLESLDAVKGRRIKIKAHDLTTIQYGITNINLQYVEQLIDPSQTRTIGDFIFYLTRAYRNQDMTLTELINRGLADIKENGLDILSPDQCLGDYALPRPYEIVAAINRFRGLIIR